MSFEKGIVDDGDPEQTNRLLRPVVEVCLRCNMPIYLSHGEWYHKGAAGAACYNERPIPPATEHSCPQCKSDMEVQLVCEHCGYRAEYVRASRPPNNDWARVANDAAREWMNTHHASFETNQERERALAAIILRALENSNG